MPAPVRHRPMPVSTALMGRALAVILGICGMLSLVGLTPAGHPAEVLLRLAIAVGGIALSMVLWGGQGTRPVAPHLPLSPEKQSHLDGQGSLWLRLLPVLGALGFLALLIGAIWAQYRPL